MASFSLGSPALDDGDSIPEEYGDTERTVTSPLSVAGVPGGAAPLARSAGATREALLDAMDGHVLAEATLEGTDA